MSGKSPAKWPVLLLLFATVAVPALFWQRVWFGSRLSEEDIRQRLAQAENSRQVQHACEQISRWMQRDPDGARQFYDPLLALADHPDEEIRSVAAWCMGEDSTNYQPFHEALLALAGDEAPRVRYNAALALARFGDEAARPVLCEMLAPLTVSVGWDGLSSEGTVVDILSRRDLVRPQMQVALIDTGQGEAEPVLAPLGGRVGRTMARLGDPVAAGEPLCAIEPDFQQVYESLRALAMVGAAEDLKAVRQYFDPDSRYSRNERARLEAQARLTAEVIQKRDEKQNR